MPTYKAYNRDPETLPKRQWIEGMPVAISMNNNYWHLHVIANESINSFRKKADEGIET